MPARSTVRDLAQIAVFAALIAGLSLPGAIPIGSLGVPITLQTLGVMLAGAILGPRKGTLAVTTYVVLALIGLPILPGGRGGLGVFVGPTGGYLLGFILGAFVIGWCTARLLPRYRILPALLVTAIGGIVAIYLIGIPWTAVSVGIPLDVAALGALAFIPGDLIKVVATVLVAAAVHRAWPGLIEPKPWPWATATDGTDAGADAAPEGSDDQAYAPPADRDDRS
ncbi:biotin transporter BioY [Agromyces rhizosphaerae]|uniref:Biotin transporter BioY n=1 Tax=Agromyces rhizosphaerae TaxID=88374 RepID=A0A9W6CT60_9MICO|nr:biotin transporter BioY [Agromyces rhizosphaerae]GLI28541.1 biotin transporter BioY [Agromyces rhizosphaerae]